MRIINLEAGARFLSYASPTMGGKSIGSGESSAEVPLDRIIIDIFKKELDLGRITIRLTDEERAYLTKLLTADKTTYTVKQLPPPPPKPVKKKPQAKKVVVNEAAKVSLDKGTSAAPDVGVLTGRPVTIDNIKSGMISLADLQKQNRMVSKHNTSFSASGVPQGSKVSLDKGLNAAPKL